MSIHGLCRPILDHFMFKILFYYLNCTLLNLIVCPSIAIPDTLRLV